MCTNDTLQRGLSTNRRNTRAMYLDSRGSNGAGWQKQMSLQEKEHE